MWSVENLLSHLMARTSPLEFRYEVWAKKFDVVNESKIFSGAKDASHEFLYSNPVSNWQNEEKDQIGDDT